jgi:PAS domain S-box-containing protein
MLMKPGSKFLRSLFEVSHVEFQTYDFVKHKLIFSSGVACKMLGYTRKQYFNFSHDFFKELIHPDDRKKADEIIEKIISSKKGEIFETTVRARKRAGNYIWIYSRQMVCEREINGDIRTIIRETEDVTDFIKVQSALKQKVEVLNAISYKNSHLLRSPVASIIGLVNLVEEQGITSEHNKEIFDYLKKAIVKLDEVIHEINDIAQID